MTSRHLLAGIALAGAAIVPAGPAATANLNVPVAVRVISFVQPPLTGVVPVAIIYQPGNAESEGEAAFIEHALAGDRTIGRASLRMRRVAVSSLGQLSGMKAAFVTAGLRSWHEDVASAAASASIVTITADTSCVVAARCVVGISGSGQTRITVNRAAAQRSHIRFGSAFLMLVREI